MAPVLHGIRIVEQGTFITGPCAGMMLADLGADVVKIERPEGDPYRSYQSGQFSPHFQAYNRNKRSLALDLNRPDDREIFDELVRKADVYIQNFRPGTADRLGAGVERLRALNPGLVYCSISGFGSTGPYADRPSYDSVAQALSGFLSVVVDTERPQLPGSGARRRDHRHLRRLRRARRAARAQPDGHRAARRGLDARGDDALRGRAVRRVLRARGHAHLDATGRGSRRPTSCEPPTSG